MRNSCLRLLHIAYSDEALFLSKFLIVGVKLKLSEALGLLIDALLLDVSLIYGFCRGVPDFRHNRSLADRHAILVDELNQEVALGVAHVRILLLNHVVDVFTIGCVVILVYS